MKEYSELIKNIEMLRRLIRDFFVFGYKSRNDFNKKSGRSYDNAKRRVASIFDELFIGEYDNGEKRYSIRIDSELEKVNPLFKLFKSKSFTNNDLILHFLILDIFQEKKELSAHDFLDYASKNYTLTENSWVIGTVVNKLNEYVELGYLSSTTINNQLFYKLNPIFDPDNISWDIVQYFSECDVLGVVGSYILDKKDNHADIAIRYKHKQPFAVLDSMFVLQILNAISKQKMLIISSRKKGVPFSQEVLPVKILVNTQNGRQYLAAYNNEKKHFCKFRIDHILAIEDSTVFKDDKTYNIINEQFSFRIKHTWNVNFHYFENPMLVEFTIFVGDDEPFIINRLKREGHGGTITQISRNVYQYSIKIFDVTEIIPWVKTFTGRIVSFKSEDKKAEMKFYNDYL